MKQLKELDITQVWVWNGTPKTDVFALHDIIDVVARTRTVRLVLGGVHWEFNPNTHVWDWIDNQSLLARKS